MKHINYKYLKNQAERYDIGKMPISSGYQRGQGVSTADFTSSPAYNMQNETSAVTKNAIGNTISQAGTIGTNLYSMGSAMITPFSSAATNVNNAISNGLVNSAGQFTQKGAEMAVKGGFTSAGSGLNAGAAGTEAALKGAGQSVSKTGMGAAGYVAGGIGAALGTYGIINDAIGFNDRLKENDMMNMSSRGTSSKYGVSYDTYGGLDVNGIKDYTNAQNTASTLSMSMNGLGTGASIGGMIGGPIGMGIGAAIGGIGGLVGGLFGSKSRKQRVEDSINSTLAAQQGYNLQAESEAGSKGLRNQYNITHADKGKNIQLTDNGKQGEIRMVHTSKGIVPGVMLGLAGKGESIYDPVDGTASVFDEGKKRVDNIPTGVPLNSNFTTNTDKLKYDNGGSWAQQIIFGNLTNPMTGNSFADDAKPYAKILEQYNKGKNNMNLSKHTELVNRKNAMNALDNLASIQSDVSKYKCGKVGKFDKGKKYKTAPWYSSLPTSFFKSNNDTYEDGRFTGGGAGGNFNYGFNNMTFNEAFDIARNAGMKTFMYGEKEYNTEKEQGVLREYNNRFVGNSKSRSKLKKQDNYERRVGPLPEYDPGKISDYLIPTVIHGGELATMLFTPNTYSPAITNTYESNSLGRPSLGIMSGIKYDPSFSYNQILNSQRQQHHNIINTGGLSSGQKLNFDIANNNNAVNQLIQANMTSQDLNNKYRSSYAEALMNYGQQEAVRKQQANDQFVNRRDASYGKLFDSKQARLMSKLNILGSFGKDVSNIGQFRQAKDFQNKLINLYDSDLKLKRDELDWMITNGKMFNPSDIPVYKSKNVFRIGNTIYDNNGNMIGGYA